MHITICGEEIVSTLWHKFYVPGSGWIPACKICTGTTLVLADGSYAEVETVKVERLHGNLPSKRELIKLQPKQLAKLAEQLEKSIDRRNYDNMRLGDRNRSFKLYI